MHVWSTRDGSLVAHRLPEERDCIPRFSPDGQKLAVGTRQEYHLFRVGSWERERTIPRRGSYGGSPRGTCFSPDGRLLVANIDQWRLGIL